MSVFNLTNPFCSFLLCASLVGCHKAEQSREDSVPLETVSVKVMTVGSVPVSVTEAVMGTVQAKTQATLEAKISGQILELNAVPGQEVKAGDVLATLDADEIRARVSSAVAVKEQAQIELARITSLLEEQSVTQQEYEITRAQERVAQAAVDEARTMLEYATVSAPFDGVIISKFSDVGDLAVPGKPLVQIEDPTRMRFEAQVPEAIVSNLTSGDRYPVRIDTVSEILPGVVSEISPIVDIISRTATVKFDLPELPGLRSGQFGRVVIPVDSQPSIFVPGDAVVIRGQMEIVFAVSDGTANLRLVRTGRVIGDDVEIISGISDGELIVVEGNHELIDGQPLSVVE